MLKKTFHIILPLPINIATKNIYKNTWSKVKKRKEETTTEKNNKS